MTSKLCMQAGQRAQWKLKPWRNLKNCCILNAFLNPQLKEQRIEDFLALKKKDLLAFGVWTQPLSKSLADLWTTQAQCRPLGTKARQEWVETSVDTHCREDRFHIWGPGKFITS